MSRFYGVLLIFTLVAASGAIAYVGDIVGRRMGRKRLSLFGMRPRHTAIAISVVSGMLITIVTLAAAMALSENVRLGFLRVGEMRAELRQLRAETKQKSAEHAQLSGQITLLDRQITTLTARAKEAAAARAKAAQALGKAKQGLAKAEREVRLAKLDLARSERTLGTTEETLTQEKRRLREAQQAVREAQAAVLRQTQNVARLTGESAKLTQQIGSLQQGLKLLSMDYLESLAKERSEGVIFDARQPLAVRLIQVNQSPSTIRDQLSHFVTHLDESVRQAGAGPAEGASRAVVVTELVQDPKTQEWGWATSDSVLEGLTESVGKAFRDDPQLRGIIVQATSLRNVHAGEPVFLSFGIFPNIQVFTRGQRIAETSIPAGASRGRIAEAVALLLKDQVRKSSEGEVMPRLDPSLPHGGAQAGNIGSGLTWEEMFDVVDRVQGLNGPARVSVVAKEDTWTIGPLSVELRVDPAS